MEIHYNLAASLIGILFGILTLTSILINSHMVRERKAKPSNRWMLYMIVICLIGCISEAAFELVNGNIFPFARTLNIIAKSTNHLESILAGFLFIGFVRSITHENEEKWPLYLRIITTITCIFGVVLVILNLFTGIAFTISPDNVYSRGPLGQLGLIISFTTLIYTVVILSIDNKRTKNYIKFPVIIYILPFLVGGGLQVTISSLRLANVAFALAIATTHLSIQRRLLYIDPMTGVYNRTYLDYFFHKSHKKTGKNKSLIYGGLLLDINSFKEINDTYGHLVGDEAIENAANILKETSGSDYLILRYGGDEFILIKENENMDNILLQKAKINEAAEKFNKASGSLYELTFSIGTTICDISSKDFDAFLDEMDKSLYFDKKAFYERTGKERRR